MRKKIENALIELGITPNHLGFSYIPRAVEIIQNSKDKIKIVNGLYVDIAKEFKTTSTAVEKSIRCAFTKMDREGEAFKKYINSDATTNSALLHILAYRLRED